MVERVHQSLKASLMAGCTGENWKLQLPWVLLGLRTAPKANGEASSAEKVYGETLVVPGEFFPTHTDEADIPIARLRETAGKFTPCLKTFSDRTRNLQPKALSSCKHVFVRNDTHHPPLTRPYQGPYHVLRRTVKAYLILIHVREDWVSINRLKPTTLIDKDGAKEEPGRCPSVPPQNRTSPEINEPPKQSCGHPHTCVAITEINIETSDHSVGKLCLSSRARYI
ncbi:uncharacterized protein LOC135199062 [Macrobrachium nipponense]|uniref:uncharacterized protein LOC135199062 n=1 Tax=Macrobrachium nipponense TaxID=159736 RepID=UPI0030C7DF85